MVEKVLKKEDFKKFAVSWKRCHICGKELPVGSATTVHKYCSKECRSKRYNKK